jgi:choline monooxygenase
VHHPISRNSAAGGWEGLAPAPGLSEADATAGRFVWLFPNTAIAVLPNHAFVLFARPEGPGRTVEEAVILTHPDSVRDADASEGLDQLERFWDLVNRQDLENRRTGPAGHHQPGLHRRPHVLPLRGAAAPLSEHDH